MHYRVDVGLLSWKGISVVGQKKTMNTTKNCNKTHICMTIYNICFTKSLWQYWKLKDRRLKIRSHGVGTQSWPNIFQWVKSQKLSKAFIGGTTKAKRKGCPTRMKGKLQLFCFDIFWTEYPVLDIISTNLTIQYTSFGGNFINVILQTTLYKAVGGLSYLPRRGLFSNAIKAHSESGLTLSWTSRSFLSQGTLKSKIHPHTPVSYDRIGNATLFLKGDI